MHEKLNVIILKKCQIISLLTTSNENLFDLVLFIQFSFMQQSKHVQFLAFTVPPIFSGQTLPTTRQVKEENSSVSYSCVAEAKPAAKIQWVLNGKNLTISPTYTISGSFQTIQGSKLFKTFSYLDIAKITWRQYGNFSCVAHNEAGQVRQNTELEVRCKYKSLVC